MNRFATFYWLVAVVGGSASLTAADGNRLEHVGGWDRVYYGRALPGGAVTRWRGEATLGAVAVVDADRLRDDVPRLIGLFERLNRGDFGDALIRLTPRSQDRVCWLDLNGDRLNDFVSDDGASSTTRLWSSTSKAWAGTSFPAPLAGTRFGIVRGGPVAIVHTAAFQGAWRFSDSPAGGEWSADADLWRGLEIDGERVFTAIGGQDCGLRFCDVDGDGCTELLIANPRQRAAFFWSEEERRWRRLPFQLRDDEAIADRQGGDGGVRWIDLDEDGDQDLVVSTGGRFSIRLFASMEDGWPTVIAGETRRVVGAPSHFSIPEIADHGNPTGVWFDRRRLSVLSEFAPESGPALPDVPPLRVKLLQAKSLSGFARLLKNDGGSDRWHDYTGELAQNHHLRQLKVGDSLVWEAAPPQRAGEAKFLFLGALGFRSQPKTPGFELSVNGRASLGFDVSLEAAEWKSADGSLRLEFLPTWVSAEDAAGFFRATVAAQILTPDEPVRFTVTSRGEGSRRWFAIHPVATATEVDFPPPSPLDRGGR